MHRKELIGQASADQIAQWKKEFPGCFAIEVSGHIGYFRDPELDDLNFAASQTDSDTPLDFNKIVMKECMIGGSDDIIEKKNLFMGASKKMSKKIDGEKAKLSEL